MRRFKHNLSNYHLTSGDMGQLLPIGLTEVLPGDSFQQSSSVVLRLNPMVAPVMHPVDIRVHHFFVPNRLVWPEFEDFITGGEDGLDATVPPTITTTTTAKNLEDYYGLPRVAGLEVSALPFRGYNLIYNEYYRDQHLVAEVSEDLTTLQNVAWAKDYFTTSRPWAQLGPAVSLPLGTEAPVTGTSSNTTSPGGTNNVWDTATGTLKDGADHRNMFVDVVNQVRPYLRADLTNATAATINELRQAMALQRFQEARARYGSRYVEYLRYLGVKSSDGRLDRPEYLGGGQTKMQISEIMQTAPETIEAGLEYGVGDLYGHGIGALRSQPYRRYFEEHGYIHSLLSVRPKAIYMNGIDRHWQRETNEDYFQKELQFIGQQEVRVNEIYASAANGENTFGYQDRYREYREVPSKVTAEMKDTLKYWHLARDLTSEPALNSTFIKCSPSKRIFSQTTYNSMWIMVNHRIAARRMVANGSAARII